MFRDFKQGGYNLEDTNVSDKRLISLILLIAIALTLEALLTPVITAQENYCRKLGLRDRILNLPLMIADLYRKRWRIEDTFNTVKRLLGLSYLWTGSLNGIQLQIWGTWLFDAVLVDLGDAVANELSLPFHSISLEMIYRGLYHFYVAHQKGKATDPIKYFAAPENKDLGIVKRQRKPNVKLIFAPLERKTARH